MQLKAVKRIYIIELTLPFLSHPHVKDIFFSTCFRSHSEIRSDLIHRCENDLFLFCNPLLRSSNIASLLMSSHYPLGIINSVSCNNNVVLKATTSV